MMIKLDKPEFVEIEGLIEAAIASSDDQLVCIVNYADLAASYLPEEFLGDDLPLHSTLQLREACMLELSRRHGDDFMLPDVSESSQGLLRVAA